MAKTPTTRAAAAMVVTLIIAFAGAGRATAAPGSPRAVVLHLSDLAGVSERDRTEAEKRVIRVYERIGVRLAWTNGDAAHAPADDALHLDVIVLPGNMSDRKNASHAAFGQASHATRRAYVYFSRIQAYARPSQSDPVCVLATVLAHEIGHMLLPEYGHSRSGLMRAEWTGRIVDVPDFNRQESTAIRSLLTPPNTDTIEIADNRRF